MGVDYRKPIVPGVVNVFACEETFGGMKTHGAKVVVEYLGEAMGYMHLTAEAHTKPHVELFPDGVLVGCTFVRADALKKIASEHAAFLVSRTKVLQP